MNPFPISVLFFSNESIRAGAEEHMLTLLQGLDRRWFSLHLVCPRECMEKLRPDLPSDVELIPMCLRKPSQTTAFLQLARVLRQRRVDILHSHMFYASVFASPIGWLCGVPVIVETPHVREQLRRGWLKSRYVIDRFVGRFVDYYIAVSQANADYLKKEKSLADEKIVVIRNGCNLARYDPQRPAPPAMKQVLGFEDDDRVLLVVARLEHQKGHSVLLDALPLIHQQHSNVRVIFVGEGSLRNDLERKVSMMSLGSSVRFVGYQANVTDWLALSDMVVLPSLYEGLPLVAIESLAAGRPLVATEVDGIPEVVINGKTGLTVSPGSPTGLAHAICRLIRDPVLSSSLVAAGRQWVLEHFSSQNQVRRTEEFYLQAWQRTQVLGTRVRAQEDTNQQLTLNCGDEVRAHRAESKVRNIALR